MGGEESPDVPFDQIAERVSALREAAGRADEVLRDQIRSALTSVFTGLNGHVLNEARDLQAFMTAINPKCDGQARVTIHGFRRQIEDILREREPFSTGALAGVEFEADTPDVHIERITDLSRRIQSLCPLVVRLEGIRHQLDELYDMIRTSEEGR